MTRLLRLAVLFLLASVAPALAQQQADLNRYTLDREHTNIFFSISHVGFSEMLGRVTDFDGSFIFDADKPGDSSVEVTMKPSSITTSSRALDGKLQTIDFFDTERFPTMTFKSTGVSVSGNDADVTGDLTMRGLTRPVTLKVHFNKADFHPMTGSYIAGFSAQTTLKRSDFGMTTYLPMIGDEVRILIQTEGVNAARSKPINRQ